MKVKWFRFYTITAVVALIVFGGFAASIQPWRYSWLRPLMLLLEGFAVLGSQYMIAEEDCQEEMSFGG